MNQNNYASLEASKRLVEAGIVLETDCVWAKMFPMKEESDWKVFTQAEFNKHFYDFDTYFPSPSMTEVWRELPEGTRLQKGIAATYAWSRGSWDETITSYTNPADAIIDLLIHLRGKEGA